MRKYLALIFIFIVFTLFTNLRFFDRGFDSFFGQIRNDEEVESGEEIVFHVNVANRLDDDDNGGFRDDLEDLKVRIFILELGEMLTANSFDVDDMDSAGKFIFWDTQGVPPGEYLARITLSNDDFREVKHRYITIV